MKHRRPPSQSVKVLGVAGEQVRDTPDTSSAAEGTSATVGGAAAMWAALTLEPMVAKSAAANVISSGAAITYDMSVHLLAGPW
jgi:hypothetical protein